MGSWPACSLLPQHTPSSQPERSFGIRWSRRHAKMQPSSQTAKPRWLRSTSTSSPLRRLAVSEIVMRYMALKFCAGDDDEEEGDCMTIDILKQQAYDLMTEN